MSLRPRRYRAFFHFSVATAATLLTTGAAQAQESTTRGFVIGAHLGGASLTVEDSDRSNGGGGGIVVGYGLNRSFTLFVQLDGSSVDVRNQEDVEGSWGIAHADFGVRYHFANSLRSWVPYLQGAFTARAVRVTDLPPGSLFSDQEVEFSGGAFTLGGGIMLYPSQTFAFDLGLLFSGGEFTDVTVGQTTQGGLDLDASSSRFNLGIVWWP
jgi:hypothetical protein